MIKWSGWVGRFVLTNTQQAILPPLPPVHCFCLPNQISFSTIIWQCTLLYIYKAMNWNIVICCRAGKVQVPIIRPHHNFWPFTGFYFADTLLPKVRECIFFHGATELQYSVFVSDCSAVWVVVKPQTLFSVDIHMLVCRALIALSQSCFRSHVSQVSFMLETTTETRLNTSSQKADCILYQLYSCKFVWARF